ncbi:MAG: DUF167 domain-containing protein [Ktedonobacterales bacterium]
MAHSRPPDRLSASDTYSSASVVREADGRLIVSLHVTPRARRDALSLDDGVLRVSVRAPAVDGAANDALIALLADRLDLPRRAFTLLAGISSRQKRLAITGMTADEFQRKLQPPC